MAQLPQVAGAVLAACLLQACGGVATRPGSMDTATAPLLRLDDSAGLTAEHYYQLGRYFQRLGQDGDAASAYQRSIALDPHQLDARNAQAVLLAAQGRYDDAIALLRQVIADYPAQAQPLNNLGYIDHLRGDERAADNALRQALRLDPGHAQARANLALVQTALARAPATTTATAMAASASATATSTSTSTSSLTAPQTASTVMPLTASTMELVQMAPHEFSLQARPVATAVIAMAVVAAPSDKAVPHSAQTADLAPPADATAFAQTARVDGQADTQIQIVNGNGVAGMGERVRRVLMRRGALAGASVVNQRRHYQRHTIIEYANGREQQARALGAALQGHALLLGGRRLPDQTGIRLVLGRDLIGHIALIDAGSGHPLAQQEAARHDVTQQNVAQQEVTPQDIMRQDTTHPAMAQQDVAQARSRTAPPEYSFASPYFNQE